MWSALRNWSRPTLACGRERDCSEYWLSANQAGGSPLRWSRPLHQRWVRFNDRGKRPVVANVAIARELVGWRWSLGVLDE